MPIPDTPKHQRPQLTNRGTTGLLQSFSNTGGTLTPAYTKAEKGFQGAPYRIAPALEHLATPIDTLIPDPVNARLHPERNMEAIRQSLKQSGQVKPIVVRAETRVVMAGNGTLAAAKSLGWTDIAAVMIDGMTDAQAAAYGIADNRTAELARWDFEVLARLDKEIAAEGMDPVGWSDDELQVIRAAEWTPPEQSNESFGGSGGGNGDGKDTTPLIVSFSPDEYEPVGIAIEFLKLYQGSEGLSQAEALTVICKDWIDRLEAENAGS